MRQASGLGNTLPFRPKACRSVNTHLTLGSLTRWRNRSFPVQLIQQVLQ